MMDNKKLHEYRILRYGWDKENYCVVDTFQGRTSKREDSVANVFFMNIPELLESFEEEGWEFVTLFQPRRASPCGHELMSCDLVIILRRPKEKHG